MHSLIDPKSRSNSGSSSVRLQAGEEPRVQPIERGVVSLAQP
jgi:hypothetical protein